MSIHPLIKILLIELLIIFIYIYYTLKWGIALLSQLRILMKLTSISKVNRSNLIFLEYHMMNLRVPDKKDTTADDPTEDYTTND